MKESDTLLGLQISTSSITRAKLAGTAKRRQKRLAWYLCLGGAFCIFILLLSRLCNGQPKAFDDIASFISPAQIFAKTFTNDEAQKSEKVLVELFVMSRCPDALKVEEVFNSVVPEVHSIMDIQLNFIATLDPDAAYGAKCMHGDEECRGNIDELCALNHKPDLPSFWRFLSCLNNHFSDIGRESEMSLKCANSAGLDTSAFLSCTTQEEGLSLFKKSVESAQNSGVTASATVYIDGKLRCVENGGWYNCPDGHNPSDFIRDICSAYKGTAPKPSICVHYKPTLAL